MTDEDLGQALADYGRGLDAELALLSLLDGLADRQREATASTDLTAVGRVADQRHRALQALLEVEARVRPLRDLIARHAVDARRLDGFAAVARRHRQAERAVASILARDEQILVALRDAGRARRLAAQAIEAGEATLAAYRRVVAPPLASAGLVSRKI
jgi:hypothetical protein